MRSFVHSLLLVIALGSGAALAQRKVQEFKEVPEMTPEELAASKLRRSNVSSYGKDTPAEVRPIPWMAIGLSGIALMIALPFAVRAYRETAGEIQSRRG